MNKTVVELFAGVGGFRVGLNKVTLENNKVNEKDFFSIVWANQWEPNEKKQYAFNCYTKRFGNSSSHSNLDIAKVDKKTIPDHNLLVGGFPCQDYSVARPLSGEKGIEGKKGVLWWQIFYTLKEKKTPFVLLENVDRLLASPSKQRGRDFGIMLRSLNDLGYFVEWRIINSGDYGYPQRRRRIFIYATKYSTNYFNTIKSNLKDINYKKVSFFESIFPVNANMLKQVVDLTSKKFKDVFEVSKNFNAKFFNSGFAYKGKVTSFKVLPCINQGIPIKNILQEVVLDEKYYLVNEEKMRFLKGAKRIPRIKNDLKYLYSEGKMSFPENLELPGRTILTSEGTHNRSSHVVEDPTTLKNRFLTPVECERLNQFPDDWTNTGMSIRKRYFVMGNALVTGVISAMGEKLFSILDKEV
jgi:DNA (cytosine-5)-methyltransferase 1